MVRLGNFFEQTTQIQHLNVHSLRLQYGQVESLKVVSLVYRLVDAAFHWDKTGIFSLYMISFGLIV
jgi:hypothetical protein